MERKALSRDEVTCPICYSFIVDPVTLPCKHNVCWHCYDRHIDESSIYCPVCRFRLSTWARQTAKTNSFVNLFLKALIARQFPGPFEAQKRRLEAEAEGMKTEEADDEMLSDFMKEETPPVMDRIFAEPGEMGKELERLYSRCKEDWEKEQAEAELASESFIKENYTDDELKILIEMEENLVFGEGEQSANRNRKHRRSPRLADKDDAQKRRLLCENKSPPVSRIPMKTTPHISQNSPQTNARGNEGTPSKSVRAPTKGVSQKKTSHRRSGRLAAKPCDSAPIRCVGCGNKPTASRTQSKITRNMSQNSPQTNGGDGKQGTSSKSAPNSTEVASQIQKSYRRSARLAAKAGSGSEQKCCSFCGNKPPNGSRIQRKITQNLPQTIGNDKPGVSSKSGSSSTKVSSQKKKPHSANGVAVAILGEETMKARDESAPCSSSSIYAQFSLKTSPINSNHGLGNSSNRQTLKLDSAKASQPLIISTSTEEGCQPGVSLTFNLRSHIFEARDHHNKKGNFIPSTKRQHPSKVVTSNTVTEVSKKKGKKSVVVVQDHNYYQTMEHQKGFKRIQDLRSKQEAKDRRIAKILQNMCRYDYEAPRLRPRKST